MFIVGSSIPLAVETIAVCLRCLLRVLDTSRVEPEGTANMAKSKRDNS